MNCPSPCGVGGAWAKGGSLLVLVAAGIAGGAYLSASRSPSAPEPPPDSPQATTTVFRFPLSALDVKDTSEAPDLAADAAGRVYLAWPSQTGPGERTLFLAATADRGATFTSPAKIATSGIFRSSPEGTGRKMTFERKMAPHVAIAAGKVVLTWSSAKPDGSDPRLVVAESADGGATFGEPTAVHTPAAGRPTFPALAASSAGAVACSWLDSRAKVQQVYAAVRPTGSAIPSRGAAAFGPEVLVHAGEPGKGVCPCCPTAATFAPDGTLFVAFRNLDAGYRDIAVARLRPGATAFDPPVAVVSPTWKFDGCPHDGPSLAVAGGRLHVTWMDARSARPRVYYGSAALADLRFETRELNPIAPGTQGNAKLFADAAGGLHAVWEESLGAVAEPAATPASGRHKHAAPSFDPAGGRAVRYAYSAKADGTFTEPRAIDPHPGKYQTRPAVVVTPTGDVFAAWHELGDAGKSVAVTRVSP